MCHTDLLFVKKRENLKMMKKFLSIIIAVIIVLQTTSIVVFADNSINDDVNSVIVSDISVEEKTYCTATLDDNFADDCVIIVIDHENSIVDRIFTSADFPGVDVKEITYLTSPITPLFEESETEEEVQEKAEILALTNVEEFNHIISIDLNVTGKEKVLEAIKVLEGFDFVISAEPNYFIEIEDAEETEFLSQVENISSNNASLCSTLAESDYYDWGKIQIEEAWEITTGSKNIRVGVIDSGISAHPDLIGNITDDLRAGWDFYNDEFLTDDDDLGHGTKVAGIIGAVGNNGIGISGINWNVTLIPLQVTDSDNSIDIDATIKALEHARTENIPIINCSWGNYGEGLANALKEPMKSYNGLIVCSAGNELTNTDEKSRYPSCFDYDNIVSVAATNENDNLVTYKALDKDGQVVDKGSNYGETTVDLAAPGWNVLTTFSDGSYNGFNQTSCAAPHVAGVAALILSVRPDLSAEQVKACILNGVDKVDALEGKCVTGGRLNAYKAVQLALDFPSDQMVSGDFDGNGKDDVAYITDTGYGSMKIYVRKNGNGAPTLWTEEKSFYTANVDDRVTAGDFNGDGKDDIALLYDNKNAKARIHVLLSKDKEDGFKSRSSWFVQATEGAYDANRTTGRVTSGDFNGDGKDDVSAMYDYGDGKMQIHMFISNGNGFSLGNWYEDMAGGNFYASGVTGRYEAGDFNGDGKDDIAAMYGYADGRTRVHVWLSNGTSLNQRTAWFIQDTPYYYNTERVKNRFVAGDFNDDGKDDIGTLYEYSGGTMMLHVFVSQSDTFSWWQNWYHSSTEGSFYTDAVTGFNSGDYNGDGKLDIMLRYSYRAGYSKLLQYQSTGSSFNYIAKFLYWETII